MGFYMVGQQHVNNLNCFSKNSCQHSDCFSVCAAVMRIKSHRLLVQQHINRQEYFVTPRQTTSKLRFHLNYPATAAEWLRQPSAIRLTACWPGCSFLP